METVKEHYPNADMKKATIKPDLPQKKSVEALFALAQQKLAMESTQVILILDMDCIIKNTPCLEFWYLLHFSKTHKFFPDFSAMEATLRKQPGLEEYDKSEDYYKKSPNIYDRLGGEEGIRMARNNAMPFSLAEAKSTGISEMNKFFEIFEK